MTDSLQNKSRQLPQVDKVLRHPSLVDCIKTFRRDVVSAVTRTILQEMRANYQSQIPKSDNVSRTDQTIEDTVNEVAAKVVTRLDSLRQNSLRRVINGTGVLLSTNLGRAPISKEIAQTTAKILQGYSNLELNMQSGKRGERGDHYEELLHLLTGCESALLVNNNAAAVLLAVTALATDKEVIVSRGELIEIGGSFRLPDVIECAGGKLKEVGTTNRTRASDYSAAISEETGAILKCHRSNFNITGFTEDATTSELVQLGKNNSIVVIEDLGSGALLDFSEFGLKHEPTVREVLALDVDLVMFSGDKLMGGSQTGIICGKAKYINQLRKHSMYRALRSDKLTISLIENVLIQYLYEEPQKHVQLLLMATSSPTDLKLRVEKFSKRANDRLQQISVELCETTATFGGGTLPGHTLSSFGLVVHQKDALTKMLSADKLLRQLRQAPKPVIAIIETNRVVIDFITVLPEEEDDLLEALASLES